MRITIVSGFFLPVPPAAGGATEKTWHRLAQQFAAAGHEVTYISRRWTGWPDTEVRDGVRHVRLRGHDHRRKLWQNLVLDAWWSRRVTAALPAADVAVVHAVALPVWLGRRRPDAGRVVVMPGRMPKGQYRWYRRIARVMATSSPVRERVIAENPALGAVTRVTGYPIDWPVFAQPRPAAVGASITIGYVGRLHREKGLDLLVEAAVRLARDPGLPAWRLIVAGPADVSAGGSGTAYRDALSARLAGTLPAGRCEFRPPVYAPDALARIYREIDVFAYPSLAAEGETFGVGVAEAMAAGAAPVVSGLACFGDFVRPGETGERFDHHAADPAGALADALRGLLVDAERRRRLATAAQQAVRRYDFARYGAELVEDFARLHSPLDRPAGPG